MLASLLAVLPAAADPTPPPPTASPTMSQTTSAASTESVPTESASTESVPTESAPADSTPPAASPPPLQPVLSPATARSTMIAFSWTAVPGATGYRVQLKPAVGAPLAEQSAQRTAAVFGGLKPNTAYRVQVLAVGPDGLVVGQPSAELPVTTPYPLAAPVVQADVQSSIRAELTWVKPPRGVSLQLEWTAPGRKPKTSKPKGTRIVRDALKQGTTYQVRARLLRKKSPQSAWSAPLKVTTPKGDPLRVASYNIQCANCRDWGPRRQGVADTIIDARLDVVGLQEASHAKLKGSDRTQFEDVARLLAPAGYRLTNLTRFNCRKADTNKKCRPVSRGASGAVRIAYNTATVRLISQGSRQLADLPGIGRDRYVAWAVFEHKINGKRFLFTSTHLEPRNDTPGSQAFYRIRKAQAQEVARVIAAHRRGMPAIAVGDYNSTKWDTPSNAPYDVMRAAGFVDPLGNGYRSTTRTTGATVEKRINTEYSSYNDLQRDGRRNSGVNGSNPDYIFVTPMTVLEYETVVELDAAGRLTGVLPSDHNLIRATVLLP